MIRATTLFSCFQYISRAFAGGQNNLLGICVVLSFLFGTLSACQPEDASPNSGTSALGVPGSLQSRSEGAIPNGDDYYQDALDFRDLVDDWRANDFSGNHTFTGVELAEELNNTYNMLWGNPTAVYLNQSTSYDSVAVPDVLGEYSAAQALAAYEGIKEVVEKALASYTGTDAGIRFVSVSAPVQLETGTYLNVYTNVGDGNQETVSSFPNVEQLWGETRFDPTAACVDQPQSDDLIQNLQNQMLGNRIWLDANGSGVVNNKRSSIRIRLVGNAVVSLSTNPTPGAARDADLVEPLLRYARVNAPSFPLNSQIGCVNGTFPNEGQYLVHYECDGNEICFSAAKGLQYFNDHSTLGDGVIETRWRQARAFNVPAYTSRIGAFVQSQQFRVSGSIDFRAHFAKFFYATPLILTEDILIPPM